MPVMRCFPLGKAENCYSTSIASAGHSLTQAPQLMHSSASTTALSSTMLMASTGHADTQTPQPKHFSLSISAAIVFLVLLVFALPKEQPAYPWYHTGNQVQDIGPLIYVKSGITKTRVEIAAPAGKKKLPRSGGRKKWRG
jgi:hypothetical protein